MAWRPASPLARHPRCREVTAPLPALPGSPYL